MPDERTACDAIAQRLRAAGCRHAFGVPGGEVLALIEAFDRAGIDVHLVKHENCGGFMAEGTWHADGAPGVLFATIGPGIANAANAIANAEQDRVPLIVVTASVSSAHRHTYTHQVFDHRAMLSPITKAAFLVEPGTADVLADKALSIARAGRPGPVLLDVPVDIQNDIAPPVAATAEPQRPMVPDAASLMLASSWLDEATRPLVIAGLDVVVENSGPSVLDFCEAIGAPLITTYKAKGVVAEDHELALGGAGLSPLCDEILRRVVAEADCILLAGYDPIEMRIGWQNPARPDQRLIEIGAEPNTHYMHQASLNFTGHVGATLEALLTAQSPRRPWPQAELDQIRAELAKVLRIDEEWGPAAVVDEARRACPTGTVATVDSGAHRIVLSQIWTCDQSRGLLQSTGLCTMGAAVPLAIGRKLAEPTRPVVAFVGDAGLEMYLGELATIRDLQLGIPIVVFVDAQLGLIELKQRGLGQDYLAVEFPATDFTAVAEAMGGQGCIASSRGELRLAIHQAFDRETFTLISAMIGSCAYDDRI